MASLVSEPFFLYGIIGAGALALLCAGYLLLKRRARAGAGEKAAAMRADRLAYQPESRPIPAVPQKAIPRPVQKPGVPQRPREISLLDGRQSITESLQALSEKYSLEQVTIATADGLVFASSGGDAAQIDAATYSGFYPDTQEAGIPGIALSRTSHKGSDLVLIIRTPGAVPAGTMQCIENDTKDILNWWI
jgi:hypothetical protein